ncbi:MAG: putative bifunctional diguanylate cyclase/phosphodiesterase, partial [Rhizobiaceae bacterium]
LICAAIVVLALANQPGGRVLGLWAISLSLVSGMCIFQCRIFQERPFSEAVTFSEYRSVANFAALMGALWGMLGMLIYPYLQPEFQIVLIAAICGMFGGAVVSLYMLPRAMFYWLGAAITGSAIALFVAGTFVSYVIAVLLILYALSLFISGYAISATYTQAKMAHFEVSDQSDTISILLRDFSEKASDWLWEFTDLGEVTRGSEKLENLLGLSLETLVSGNQVKNIDQQGLTILPESQIEELLVAVENQKSFQDLLVGTERFEADYWVVLSGSPLWRLDGSYAGYRGVASDVTRQKRDEKRIAYLAHHDALTGLMNREKFTRILNSESAGDTKSRGSWCVYFLDLDGFKTINDQEGHATGDTLLKLVSDRISSVVSDLDIVARLGGDEFAILATFQSSDQAMDNLARAIIHECSRPYLIDGKQLSVGISIGIAKEEPHDNDLNNLLNKADLALYQAKAKGKSTYCWYDRSLDEATNEHRLIEADLKNAIKNREISVSYQPQVSAITQEVIGFEALARWNHPERGNIPPSVFIPVAEKLGIINEIGEWVLGNACKAAASWPGGVSVAVNMSIQQFHSDKIISVVERELKLSGLKPEKLEIEITESLFMENTEEVIEILEKLKKIGIQIALDDFGTGYSSLSYLMKFPFDKLKVDRSFIQSVDDGKGTAKSVLNAITELGRVLNLKVTAEGIETQKQMEMLQELNCTYLQGYYFGQPLAESEISGYMLKNMTSLLKDGKPAEENNVISIDKRGKFQQPRS